MDASSVTICWSLPSATPDADGYVIHFHTGSGPKRATVVEGGLATKHTLRELEVDKSYTLKVRAYQDILGPPSNEVNFIIPGQSSV